MGCICAPVLLFGTIFLSDRCKPRASWRGKGSYSSVLSLDGFWCVVVWTFPDCKTARIPAYCSKILNMCVCVSTRCNFSRWFSLVWINMAGGSLKDSILISVWQNLRKWLVDVHSPDWPLRDVVDDVLSLVDIAAKPSRVGILESHSLHREGCRKYQICQHTADTVFRRLSQTLWDVVITMMSYWFIIIHHIAEACTEVWSSGISNGLK